MAKRGVVLGFPARISFGGFKGGEFGLAPLEKQKRTINPADYQQAIRKEESRGGMVVSRMPNLKSPNLGFWEGSSEPSYEAELIPMKKGALDRIRRKIQQDDLYFEDRKGAALLKAGMRTKYIYFVSVSGVNGAALAREVSTPSSPYYLFSGGTVSPVVTPRNNSWLVESAAFGASKADKDAFFNKVRLLKDKLRNTGARVSAGVIGVRDGRRFWRQEL
jgi:hypothetical protein